MLTDITIPLGLDDLRLKVLWIEDRQSVAQAYGSDISALFSIQLVRGPGQLSAFLSQELPEVQRARLLNLTYAYPRLPFDGYLADFNLSGASVDEESRVVDVEPESPADESVVMTDRELEELNRDSPMPLAYEAKVAEAAGLTSATLCALNFEGHPAVIVPYTGYGRSQLGAQWALVQLLMPRHCLKFADKFASDRPENKPEFRDMLERFATTYREALPEWADNGFLHVRYAEKERLSKLAALRARDAGDFEWEAGDYLEIESPYMRRKIGLRTLWYRRGHGRVSHADVVAWLDRFPVADRDYREAVALADTYWQLADGPESQQRYRLADLILRYRSGGDDMPGRRALADEIRALASQTGAHQIEVVFTGGADLRSLRDYDRSHEPHLTTAPNSDLIKRLAVLMIALRAELARFVARLPGLDETLDEIREELTADFMRAGISTPHRINVEELEGRRRASPATLTVLRTWGIRELFWTGETLVIEPLAPLKDVDLQSRLDPLPKNVVPLWESVQRDLRRKKFPLADILAGRKPLPRDQVATLQRHARELRFPQQGWPRWIQ